MGEEGLSQDRVSRLIRSVSFASHTPTATVDPFDVHDPDWNLERTLRAAIQRSEESGVQPLSPPVSLCWQDVTVTCDDVGQTFQTDAGSVFKSLWNGMRSLWRPRREKTILHSIDGYLAPGETLLVLGAPGSGCTTLLKVLAGHTEHHRSCGGSITYNGVPLKTMRERFRSMMLFNGENDTHFPYLTVAQTIDFAASTKAPHGRITGISRQDYIKTTRKILLAAFGLSHTANTRVGNDFVRGVSGGERRRVSIVEMLLARACVSCWDNPTRGLDSQTSLDFAQALRVATNLAASVAVSALYQPSDALAGLYDKVTLLHEGHQVFFGTLEDGKSYFEGLGFVCDPRQTISEFLVTVTDRNACVVKQGFRDRVPRTAAEFADTWRSSEKYRQLRLDMESRATESGRVSEEISRFKAHVAAEKAPATRPRSPYSLNIAQQFGTTFHRALQRIRGEYAYFVAITMAMLVVPILIGTMFYDIDPGTSGFFSKGGVVFFIVLFNVIATFAEVAAQFTQRPIVEKHHSYGMYHPYIDALSTMVSQFPLKALNILIFSVIVYFLAGLKREAGPFFLFVLFAYVTTLTMTAWFRFVAGLANTVELALAIAGLSVLPLAIYGGYALPRPSMHPWFKWISYINPIFYSVETLMAVEFHGREAPCQSLVPSGPGYEGVSVVNQACAVVGAKPGNSFVLGDDYLALSFDYHYSHVWRNLGISMVFFAAFTFLYAFTTEFKKLDDAASGGLVYREAAPRRSNNGEKTGEQTLELQPNQDVFCWKHVNYDIQIKGENRRLLQNVQGYVEPGKLTALMGASGAGKTTLLNVLAQRTSTGVVSGDITINGVPLSGDFKRRTGYCMQQDIHMEEMTVREALEFSAMLRQPQDTPASHKVAYVDKIISLLKMDEYADAVIGIPGRGLGAEMRKRTTIGIELVARPSLLLFLDEPTSGLDSQSAISIVQLLRDLADAGQAILCTIHQPSSTLLGNFDRLLLLASGGQTVYFGDLGKDSSEVLAYFEQYGAPACPKSSNPAEYFLEQVGAGASSHATMDWPSVWSTSTERQAVTSKIQQLESGKSQHTGERQALHSTFAVNWFAQYKLVQKRLFVQHWRSPTYIYGKLFINVVGGLFIAFTFYRESSSIQGLQNKMFSVFGILVLCLTLIFLLQPRLLALRNIYDVREKHSNMYHWSVFLVANIVVEIPFNFIISTLGFICWFFPVGWWRDISAGRGAFMWLAFLLYQAYHTTFAQALAIVSPNPETAAMVTILFYTFVLVFSGVLQPLGQLVKFWHFAYYVSPFTWLVSTLMSAGTHGVAVQCAPAEVTRFQPPEGQTCGEYAGAFTNATMAVIYNPEARQNCEFCSMSVADAYLSSLNIDYADRWRNIGFLVVYIVFNVLIFTAGFYLHSYPIALKSFGFKRRTGGS